MNPLSKFAQFLHRGTKMDISSYEIPKTPDDPKEKDEPSLSQKVGYWAVGLALLGSALSSVAMAETTPEDIAKEHGIPVQIQKSGTSGAIFNVADSSCKVIISTNEIERLSKNSGNAEHAQKIQKFVQYHELSHCLSLAYLSENSEAYRSLFGKRTDAKAFEDINTLGKQFDLLYDWAKNNDTVNFNQAFNSTLNSKEFNLIVSLQAITLTQELCADAIATLMLLRDGDSDAVKAMIRTRFYEDSMFPQFTSSNHEEELLAEAHPLRINNHNTKKLMDLIYEKALETYPNLSDLPDNEIVKIGVEYAAKYYQENASSIFGSKMQNIAQEVGKYFQEGAHPKHEDALLNAPEIN